jgi:hypothetical protein
MKKLLLLVILFISYSGFACSCLYSEFGIQDYQKANYVLNGKILNVTFDENTKEKIITFKVSKAIKGAVDTIVEIRTAKDSAACGLNVKENDTWLFFVHEYNGRWNVGLCGKNVRYNQRKGESKEQQKKQYQLVEKMTQQMKEFKNN